MQRNPSSRRPPVQQRLKAPARKVVQPAKHRKFAPKQAGRRLNLPR